MKYLGVDYGTKHIGVAVSDDEGRVAFPLTVITASPLSAGEVAALARERGVSTIILGESRGLRGQRNAVAEDVELFKKDLEELASAPVRFEQEFFTSALAARQFTPEEKSPSGVGRSRASRKQNPEHKDLDASAAALILQTYLDKKQ